MHMYHLLFLPSPVIFLCRRRVFWCDFFCNAVRGPVDVFLAVCGVHGTSVARAVAAESRKNWLYFAGYQFRKKWKRRWHVYLCVRSIFVFDTHWLPPTYNLCMRHIFFSCVNGTNKRQSLASPPGGTCRPPEGEPCIYI